MKKLITFVTTAFILTATTWAQGPWNVGSYWGADNVIATFSNGTLTFTGEGRMTNFDALTTSFKSPWYDIREQITTIVLDPRITSIGDDAFNGCVNLTGSLPLHEGITYIGIQAFQNCSGLTGLLAIPQSVTTIRGGAFENCSGLTGDLIIPEGVTTLGDFNTFSGCSGLNGILSIPAGVTAIGPYAFSGCSGLTGSLTLPQALTVIEKYAFNGCSNLTGELVIPQGVTKIREQAFYACSGLTGDLIIPEKVTTLEGWAFCDCSGFTSLSLPESCTTFGYAVFLGCYGLTSINNYAGTPQMIDNTLFDELTLSNITLNVPASSVAAYQDAAVWKEFNIAGSLSSVDEIAAGKASVVAYYSILGVKLPQEPQNGSYIVLYDNGKTEKRIKQTK
jgi:hypothetical protein